MHAHCLPPLPPKTTTNLFHKAARASIGLLLQLLLVTEVAFVVWSLLSAATGWSRDRECCSVCSNTLLSSTVARKTHATSLLVSVEALGRGGCATWNLKNASGSYRGAMVSHTPPMLLQRAASGACKRGLLAVPSTCNKSSSKRFSSALRCSYRLLVEASWSGKNSWAFAPRYNDNPSQMPYRLCVCHRVDEEGNTLTVMGCATCSNSLSINRVCRSALSHLEQEVLRYQRCVLPLLCLQLLLQLGALLLQVLELCSSGT